MQSAVSTGSPRGFRFIAFAKTGNIDGNDPITGGKMAKHRIHMSEIAAPAVKQQEGMPSPSSR